MLKAIVLAAGKGSRLLSENNPLPKSLRLLGEKPLLAHVLQAIDFIPSPQICLVIGFRGDMVKEAMGNSYRYAIQSEQLGTGHAVMCAKDFIKDKRFPTKRCPGCLYQYQRAS
jgi:bifunctional N-acetylglucosamine-1-phosphate-uridyltransferase/glucosamine-1-phosphate-acetyltransferase GlmU-like protein